MYNEWYHYIQDIYQQYQLQQEKITRMEKQLAEIEKTMAEQNRNVPESIEYHFDQLKIENLNGALHIGLSPSDLASIEDLQGVPFNNQANEPNSVGNGQLVSNLREFLYKEGPSMLANLSEEYRFPIDQGYQTFLIQDIQKQIPSRIAYYENKVKNNDDFSDDTEKYNYIFEQIKAEIFTSLSNYIQNNSEKGVGNDENGSK